MRNAYIPITSGFFQRNVSFHFGNMRPTPADEPTSSIHAIRDLHHTSLTYIMDGELPTNADEYAPFIRIIWIASKGKLDGWHRDKLQVGSRDEIISYKLREIQ